MGLIDSVLRGVTVLLTVITMALVGNVVAMGGTNPTVNYGLFVTAWTLLFALIGAFSGFLSFLSIPFLWIGLDVLTCLWNFVAGVVFAARLHVHSCGNSDYLASNPLINGASDRSGACHELQAATAFFWFIFALLIASAAFTALSSRGSVSRGPARKGPSMSHV